MSGFTLNGYIEVYNGGLIPIGIDHVQYDVILEKNRNRLADGYVQGITISPGTIVRLPITNKINWVPTTEMAVDLLNPGDTYIKVSGNVYVANLQIIEFKIPFQQRINIEQYIRQFVVSTVKQVVDTGTKIIAGVGKAIVDIANQVFGDNSNQNQNNENQKKPKFGSDNIVANNGYNIRDNCEIITTHNDYNSALSVLNMHGELFSISGVDGIFISHRSPIGEDNDFQIVLNIKDVSTISKIPCSLDGVQVTYEVTGDYRQSTPTLIPTPNPIVADLTYEQYAKFSTDVTLPGQIIESIVVRNTDTRDGYFCIGLDMIGNSACNENKNNGIYISAGSSYTFVIGNFYEGNNPYSYAIYTAKPTHTASQIYRPTYTNSKPIYKTEIKNIINGKITIQNNMISNNDFVLQRPSKITGNFNVDGNDITIIVKIYNKQNYNLLYSTEEMIQGSISTELPSGSYYIAYANPSQHTITVITKVDATYDICVQNCN